jgi:hypothetical protein
MADARSIEKDLEGSECYVTEVPHRNFAGGTEEKHESPQDS